MSLSRTNAKRLTAVRAAISKHFMAEQAMKFVPSVFGKMMAKTITTRTK
jgi:hypothetical protein